MEEGRGAKLSQIIKQLGLNDTPSPSDPQKNHKVNNIHRITARGKGLKFVPVKRPVTFALKAPSFEQDDVSIIVTAPSGREVPTRIDTIRSGAYEVEYITPEVGDHVIEVLACGQQIPGSPFHSSGYDSSKIKVASMPAGVVEQPVEFEIDGSEAGSGNLEILVNGGHVTSEVKCLGNHRFLASFVPHAATNHVVEMKFNDDPVPGSPWTCSVSATGEFTGRGSFRVQTLDNFAVSQTQFFDVVAVGKKKEDLKVNIVGPAKTQVQHKIVDLQSDTFRIYFSASIVGSYTFDVSLPTLQESSHSFIAKAYDVSRIQVSDTPKSVVLNDTCTFQVDASQAGEGQLEIAVNDGDVPNQVQVQGNGRCLVSFKPESCTLHVVDIKFNGHNVPGCPFNVEVCDTSQFSVDVSKLELIAVGRVCKFKIDSKSPVVKDTIRVVINSPSGKQLPVHINYGEQGVSCEFHPNEVGPHVMTIEHRGRSITAAPLFIKTYDSQKVSVTPTNFGHVGRPVQFVVDAGSSGEGNLEIAVNAKGINVMTQVHPMGGARFGVSFTPTEVCDHVVFVTFNNEPVPGSPFTVSVGADVENISVSGTALNFSPIEQKAVITVHNIRNEKDLNVRIDSPNGQTLAATIRRDGGNVAVEFLPRIAGEYLIHVIYQGMPLAGSPFATKVYNIREIQVKEMPKEIVVGRPVTFLVEAANAGPGNLEVIVNNGKVPSCPQALGPSIYAISFVPKEAETHFIEIRFNGENIQGSPFICNVIDASKMIVKKENMDRIPVDREATFLVDTRGASFFEHSVSIVGPGNKQVAPTITGDPSSGYRVSFTPSEVGDHAIDVKVAGQSVPPCPFVSKVYDARNVRVSDVTAGTVSKPVYFTIDASQAGAGNLEIIVSVNGRNVPNYVQSEGNAKFRVNFKPTEANVHVVSVKFNGQAVPGSPFLVNIIDNTQSVGPGQSLKMTSIGKKMEFNIDNKAGATECKAIITAPSGKKLRPTITPVIGFFSISFIPTEVGPHHIVVYLDGSPLPGPPLSCNVYDVSRVRVTGLTGGVVGRPVTFQVDASTAGEGTLELVVTTKKTSVRAEVLMKGRGLYDVTFVPQEKVTHFLNIQFNEEDVPGSPFSIEIRGQKDNKVVEDNKRVNGEEINGKHHHATGLVGSTNVSTFDWPLSERETERLDVKVSGPSGGSIPATANLSSGKLSVEYIPREIGLYTIEGLNEGKLVTREPFYVEVIDPSKVKVVNLHEGVVGREQTFKVDASRAGRGDMAIGIKCSDRPVQHTVRQIGNAIYTVTFTPSVDRPHQIDIRLNGYHASSFPQVIDIRDPKQSIIVHGQGLKTCSPKEITTFLIETGGFAAAKDFDVIITDPRGSPLPVKCFQQKDSSLLAEFVPQIVGSHKIDVLYLDTHVSGSPFVSECFDASKVIIQKPKSNNFVVNEKISFTLNRRDVGFAELDVTVTSPLGRNLPIEVLGTPDGDGEVIEFVPTVVGRYKIAITFGAVEVPGSPVTFLVSEGAFPRIEGPGISTGLVNELSQFKIDARGLFGIPKVKVEGTDSQPKVAINEDNGVFKVTFMPVDVGVYDVHVEWNGKQVPGSPFHPAVVDTTRVRPIGGWESLLDGSGKISAISEDERKIAFDCTSAGPGKLRAVLTGPDGSVKDANVEQTAPHKFKVSFTPHKEGNHQLSVLYADHPLPRSPLTVNVTRSGVTAGDSATVVLRGHGLAGARVGEETEFIIDGGEAGQGQPEISLTGVKADIPVRVSQVSQNVFKVSYTPSIPGTYLLNVLWAGKQVKGCPLKVSILPRCDAARVLVSGDGLKGGALGKDIRVFIDTKRAGPGELSAHCMGPQKVATCELIDQLDGTFYLLVKPQEGGRHLLTIKYGGDHVLGSPFTLKVAGAPDPAKVRVYGPGIEHGVLPLYQSRFICDTRGAGAGQLTVRIRGPKGAFRVEMQRESQKDRTILCKYDPTEPGDYRIEVKWSGEHVPGSPFAVMIFDTQDELSRFLMSHSRHHIDHPDHMSHFGSTFGPVSWRGSSYDMYVHK